MGDIHITLASAIFILSSLVGLYYSLGILPRYVGSYRRTRELTDDGERTLAEGLHYEITWCELNRCVLHAVSAVAGLWSLFVPPQPPHLQSANERFFGLFVLIVLVLSNVLTTTNTLIVRRGYRARRGEVPRLPKIDSAAALLLARIEATDLRARVAQRLATRLKRKVDATARRVDDLEK